MIQILLFKTYEKFFTNFITLIIAILCIPMYSYGQCSESQSSTTHDHESDDIGGQTITAACSGTLTSFTYHLANAPGTQTIEVREGIGCSGTLLHSQSVTQTVGANTVNFSSPPALTSGQNYSIYMSATAPKTKYLLTNVGSSYPNGTLLWHSCSSLSGWDMQFDYTIAGSLPVELTVFEVENKNSQAYLNWQSASELNNEGFGIEHSGNGKDWQMIDFVPGNGTSFEQQSYSYTHDQPNEGINYYRLKQIDFDGASEYSKTVSVNMEGAGTGFFLFPNPTGGSGRTFADIDTDQGGILTFYNSLGKQVYELPFGENEHRVEVSLPDLPAGIYTAMMDVGRERFAKRIIVK